MFYHNFIIHDFQAERHDFNKDPMLTMILRAPNSTFALSESPFDLNCLCLAFHSAHKGSWLAMGL